jgi:hypothetical protein
MSESISVRPMAETDIAAGVKRRPELDPLRHNELDPALSGCPETRGWGGLSR